MYRTTAPITSRGLGRLVAALSMYRRRGAEGSGSLVCMAVGDTFGTPDDRGFTGEALPERPVVRAQDVNGQQQVGDGMRDDAGAEAAGVDQQAADHEGPDD